MSAVGSDPDVPVSELLFELPIQEMLYELFPRFRITLGAYSTGECSTSYWRMIGGA